MPERAATSPLAHTHDGSVYLVLDCAADLQTIIHQFEAHAQPDAEDHQARIACPTIILSGSEDATHQSAFALQARIPGCEMKTLPGAGHACQIEQPWLFNRHMFEFLTKHGLFPSVGQSGGREGTR